MVLHVAASAQQAGYRALSAVKLSCATVPSPEAAVFFVMVFKNEIVEYKISNKSKNGFVGAPPTKPWNSTLES